MDSNIIGCFSKKPEKTYLPGYYQKAKGVYAWIDGKKYLDMSTMGLGSCLLGYSNKIVNKAVKKAINKGNMSSFVPEIEKEFAEYILKKGYYNKKIRYARTGAEAMAIAVRLARAYSSKDKIAICGFSGWHDWYLAANQVNDGLENHLFKNPNDDGVPKSLIRTAYTFNYNDFDSFNSVLLLNIGVVVIEMQRFDRIDWAWLAHVKRLCKENKIVLIYDEITTGFRFLNNGLHKLINSENVEPDIVVYGKALSNGYPFSCIIGESEIMNQDCFISSTYWTESIGTSAALTAIKELDKKNYKYIESLGKVFKYILRHIFKNEVTINNIWNMPHYEVKKNHRKFIEMMFKEGVIVSGNFIPTFAHKKKHLKKFEKACKNVLKKW